MAGKRMEIMEEEVLQLNKLKDIIDIEKESLIAMDREKLLKAVLKKEKVVLRLKQLNDERQALAREEGQPVRGAEEAEFLNIRKKLLEDVRNKNLVQQKVLETQMAQVENLVAFFKHFQDHSAIYDRRGRLR